MSAPRQLDEHDVTLFVAALPLNVTLFSDLCTAVSDIARQHGLDEPVLLFDGTNRVVARRTGAPTRPDATC